MADWTLSAIMDGIAAYAISQGVVTRAYAYPVGNPTVPCLIVDFPKPITFDFTFHRDGAVGSATLLFPLYFVVARVLDKDARDAISRVISGVTGIVDLLDSMSTAGVSSARVVNAEIQPYVYDGVNYESVRFEYEVIAV